MSELTLRSQRVMLSAEEPPRPAQLHIRDGKIISVGPLRGDYSLDLGDQVLMPGIVDSHAHVNEPGRTEWEGFETATRAAAAGGITTVIDMPLNSIPPTTTTNALREKANAARDRCRVDYAFWGGLVRENREDLIPMVEAGVRGFKAFLIDSGVPEFSWTRENELRAGMKVLASLRVPLLAHAEVDLGAGKDTASPRTYRHYLASRPPEWEVEAIRLLIRLARETGCAVHVVHLSAAAALPDIARAKAEGVPFTVETCPHYLTFSAETIPDGATAFKCAPPIREEANREALWQGLLDGTIDQVVSDHSPCTPALKGLAKGDFDQAWGGIAGLQFSLPVTWTEMRKRGIALSRLTGWMAEAPARLAGLSGRKGKIAAGWDADLVAFEPDKAFRVTADDVRHRHSLTPYLDRELYGSVERTWVRGELVYERGKFLGKPIGERV